MAPAASARASDRNDQMINSDFDTFIRMLTAQVQNQDPLNPLDSADFAVQLATFSSVEQQVRTNDLLVDLGHQIAAQSVGHMSSWIGMEARAEMPAVFEGTPLELTLRGSDAADKLDLVVKNIHGHEVQRLEVPVSGGRHEWSGRDGLGNALPSGQYAITTQAFSQGNMIAEQPVDVHARIVEAGQAAGQLILTMEHGQTVPASAVTSLREAR